MASALGDSRSGSPTSGLGYPKRRGPRGLDDKTLAQRGFIRLVNPRTGKTEMFKCICCSDSVSSDQDCYIPLKNISHHQKTKKHINNHEIWHRNQSQREREQLAYDTAYPHETDAEDDDFPMDFDDPILPHIPDEDTFNSQLLENNTFEDEIFSLPDETGLEKLLFSVLESEGSEEMRQFAEDIRRLQLAKEETPNGFDGDVDGDEGDGEEFDDSIAPENTPLEPDIDNSWSPWPNKISMVRDTVNHFPTKNLVSQLGNHFTVTDPRNAIALQVAHPITSEFITRYPAWQPEEVSEVWHARRWYEFGFEMLNPLWISPETGKQFFVREVTRMKNGELVSRVVGQDNDLVIAQEDVITDPIPAKELLAVLEQLEDENGDVYSLNPLRSTVGINDDFLVVFVSLWADDVSGNRSKQYNKHVNIYMQNTNLPAKLLNQDHFINFISTSQHASWAEQMAEILKIIQGTETMPIQTFNASNKRKCKVVLRVSSLPCDNPQASEEASHIVRGNFLCRTCTVGGSQAEKKTLRVFRALHRPGLKRNPLLDVAGLDPAHDTPFELLHTYSLGIMKYGWRHVVSRMPKDRVDILVAKLDSAAKDCLDTDKGDALYIWRYSHSLNGRHYRFLSQSLPLQLFGILTEDEDKATCQLMLSIASLGAHLWFPVIKNLDKYINDLEILVANVQDLLDEINPDFITKKPKVHYLCHVTRDVLRYGPVIHQATERHERFNSVVRGCTIRGNGQANSHDVAAWFAHAGICAHLVTGGLFVTETGIWGAGHKVLELRQDHGLCTHLGWSVPRKAKKGKVVRLAGQKDGKSYAVEAASGDHCKVGNWVVCRNGLQFSLRDNHVGKGRSDERDR
ncbi:hypothetical protein C343_04348 [Cryptococcus neoformans C23]|uniref:Uncharacterized protein n=1 Tax=Cryptococcus neoformans (strain H99 / ATCC 208821 / CBS 10515 / FGSC 9487) TaxID=235443 RepID=J9VWY0_CRYN9|nr:hypothetical protein CNAG_05910 [Cryptococcus neoformans var. grubii H99]AFR96230.1 hypothetical protein CNAG_05910 [Cryptococcus neoformans var. grubii H99]AUB26124.1 hypothetical protein CKF44_05910 [Cryptococcus neoformans var. grubii]OWZ30646.1 hypothetical protein C347_04408 [Cryptococcus neoformans var. grubii AD2-60a]OWZ42419.1 hypothetical protein C343_04348 [Cryptococcus neoformans var. grubii C23]|eukprot:XP_012050623.1 hypothetical protein CNAG_05910 [Cryptococcus neoformans var. grubii H99]